MPVRPANNVEVKDEGTSQGFVRALNFVGAGVVAAVAGSIATVTIAGGGGSATVTQTTITLPAPANRSHSVNVTDAAVTGASKIMLSLAGQPPTAVNESDDIDMLDMMGVPGTGLFTFQARFLHPISGPLLVNYMVG